VERRLRDLLDIPVFHDDQHGTAIVVLAALTNALRVVGKKLGAVRITMAGAGAAGTAVLRLLLASGAAELGPHYIIQSVFHPDVAAAVRDAAGGGPSRS
jgi:malate dehydrogenase (oxaloacetate-decarboxylating)